MGSEDHGPSISTLSCSHVGVPIDRGLVWEEFGQRFTIPHSNSQYSHSLTRGERINPEKRPQSGPFLGIPRQGDHGFHEVSRRLKTVHAGGHQFDGLFWKPAHSIIVLNVRCDYRPIDLPSDNILITGISDRRRNHAAAARRR